MMAMPENTGTQNLGVLLVSGDRTARGTIRDFLHAKQPDIPTELYEAESAKRDPRMNALFGAARRLARYETPVLITGEPGTGKETLAQAMHELARGSRPFVAVQASATTPEEFTRAVAEAGNGTLYVDDVLA